MSKLRILDLFSGLGAFSLGLERAGMEPVAFCESDPFARSILHKHWPQVPIHDDVRTLNASWLAEMGCWPDVICGGFPCQDISLAGRGEGIDAERSGLWSEFARLIREIRPDYAIIENVAALLGRGLDRVLRDLAEAGYDAEWRIISAADVGAPHLRERVWIVGYPHRTGRKGLQMKFGPERQADTQAEWAGGAVPDAARDGSGRSRLGIEHGGAAFARDVEQREVGGTIPDPQYGGRGGRDATWVEGAESTLPSHQPVPDAESLGQPWRDGSEGNAPEPAIQSERPGRSGLCAVAGGERLPLRAGQEGERPLAAVARGDRRPTQPGLGRLADGITEGLDGPWGPGWEDGTPRVVEPGTPAAKNRRKRLIALGNALVPQIPHMIGNLILERENSR